MAINKSCVAAWLLLGLAPLAVAEKTAQPSDDFLEYLGSMETHDDNWSDFANDGAKVSGHQPAGNEGQSSSQSSSAASAVSLGHHSMHSTGGSKQ